MITIQVDNVQKSYGDTPALQDVSLSIEKGEIFGLIGPDGAGKTSLIRILTTLLLADSGTASVNGHDVVNGYRNIRREVGYMPGRFSLYQDLSVEENLRFFATTFGTTVEANYDVIRDIYQQIEPFRRRRAGALSGGMKQKLALSCALVHRPEVLFLDEPTTGVDPVSRQEFWQILKGLQDRGITILVSTPYMDEASLCDRIALIQDGRLLGIDTPSALRAAFPHNLWDLHSPRRHELLRFLRKQEITISAFPFGETLHLATKPNVSEDQIQETCRTNGFNDIHLNRIEATIEDCFMNHMTTATDPQPN